MKFATKVIHAGIVPDPSTGAIMPPIYQTSTYIQASPGDHKGFEYGRTQNPTRNVLQDNIAAIENAKHGICFASGMATTDAVIKLLKAGDEVICSTDVYGGTYRILTNVYQKYGIKSHFIDMKQPEDLLPYINDNTKMIWLETPGNPMMNIIDIEGVADIAKQHKVWLCVDNTFATPYLQCPMDLGADMVVHSATKYLGGHSDVILGAVVCNDEALNEELLYLQNAVGAVPGPMDCFLILRGLKTLHLRMEQHSRNAAAVARFLRQHPEVNKVHFPGFEDHPNHHIARKQMRDYGGMVSFSLKRDTMQDAVKVLSGTQFFYLAESLGGVESLIGHPATMTHASIPLEERQKTGVVDSLIRLSVGIEATEDLIDDLDKALSNLG